MATTVITKSSLGVAGAPGGGTTPSSTQYAIVNYSFSSISGGGSVNGPAFFHPVVKYYGPGQTIAASITIPFYDSTGASKTITYTLDNGVIFQNT